MARWFSTQGRGALAALAVSLAGAGFSAHAGRSVEGQAEVIPMPPAHPVGFDAQDHFPGAALLYVDEQKDLPVTGATGTVALPAAPVPDTAIEGDASIRAAQPFTLRGSTLDKARALQCLTTAIYYEAATEPDNGQAAVAQVILNRVRHPTFPATVCGVVYQGSERRGCQFSFACDGAMARVPMRSAFDRARRVAARALAGYVFAPVGMATHYHTYAVTPAWNRSLVMTGMFGAHLFHRWKGYWGTPAAFRQSYLGGEPLPRPHAPVDAPLLVAGTTPIVVPPAIATAATALIAQAAVPAPTPAASVQAPHVASGTVLERYADESQILDKWKDSGQPLK
ncbi:cell wall hydrolase [uncultured Sphingomonas sp.]|uniref:cell wall hydrolase n=1 Tax=uncultured Sphingomonas sp. TaxID=158754 RepID=UPI0025F53860|nr:cell wall hydrolase [uncultured Sphingomonas sp.]